MLETTDTFLLKGVSLDSIFPDTGGTVQSNKSTKEKKKKKKRKKSKSKEKTSEASPFPYLDPLYSSPPHLQPSPESDSSFKSMNSATATPRPKPALPPRHKGKGSLPQPPPPPSAEYISNKKMSLQQENSSSPNSPTRELHNIELKDLSGGEKSSAKPVKKSSNVPPATIDRLTTVLAAEVASDPDIMNDTVKAVKAAKAAELGGGGGNLTPARGAATPTRGSNKSESSKTNSLVVNEPGTFPRTEKKTTNPSVASAAKAATIDTEERESKDTSDKTKAGSLPSGIVGRRAPLNPFASPKLGKFRQGGGKQKVKDPKLNNNPLSGRLIVTYTTTALLMWVFFQELVYAYIAFNGRCVGVVLYPQYDLTPAQKPYVLNVGYGACEYNTGTKATDRTSVGNSAEDDGWPEHLVQNGKSYGSSSASWDSPNGRIYAQLGGLDTNLIRNYGEVFRVFWSMYLHGGFLHIIINLSCQIQILWMIEPDWGFWRSALLFFIGGISGNLLSAIADPCSVTVGSSGAMYSTLGALVPYCIEYWKTIPRPCCILIFMIIVIIIGIITGFTGITDNYAHMGGCMGGILWGFMTIASVAACDKCTLGERMALTPPFKWCVPAAAQQKLQARAAERKKRGNDQRAKALRNKKIAEGMRGRAIHEIKLRFTDDGSPTCKMAKREWAVRISAFCGLLVYWVVCWIYLLNPNVYKGVQPPGQLKFSGWMYCQCCDIKVSTGRLFTGTEGLYWCFGGDGGPSSIKYYCAEGQNVPNNQ